MSSTAADSSIDICSRALILIGAEPITSFTDGSTESLVASNLYETSAVLHYKTVDGDLLQIKKF